MEPPGPVQPSRDGDRFHYYWAARRSLRLLDFHGDLKALAVEELPPAERDDGDEVVDIAEYYGGVDAERCTSFAYIQLKHSTLRVAEPIVASELKTTLTKFAHLYRSSVANGRSDKIRFEFVSNRQVKPSVRASLEELAAGVACSRATFRREAETLARYMGFGRDVSTRREFCARLVLRDAEEGLLGTEQILRRELDTYLPGTRGSEFVELTDRIARCATSLEDRRILERSDVLATLRTTADALFPAPSTIESPATYIQTRASDHVIDEIRTAKRANRFVVMATGGTGKSALTTVLADRLPPRSIAVTYDCFAGGDYRKGTARRHLAHVALTQLTNELAMAGLCTPLVPADGISDHLYLDVFMTRVRQVAADLSRRDHDALLVIVVDAADNAAMAADERGHETFVRDLLREDWPANARLVELCRPERSDRLRAPAGGVDLVDLNPFDAEETTAHLRGAFAEASKPDGQELHVLSDGNPRVQAMAMESAESAQAVLDRLQVPRRADEPILDVLLANQIASVVDNHELNKEELSRLCRAVATFPPPIPMDVLAAAAEVPTPAIKSFATSLGRGIHASATTLQFRDEPTETWFRNSYRADATDLRLLVSKLMELAATSAYAAIALPQLMFEGNMLDELVELTLSRSGLPGSREGARHDSRRLKLPTDQELEAHQIARARNQFALSALMSLGRFGDAALLALQAGELNAGHGRRLALFRSNPDLTARFLGREVVDQLCASRELGSEWPGSHLHVEAALLSNVDELRGLARGRHRAAIESWIALSRRTDERGHYVRQPFDAEDAGDLGLAILNVDGPGEAATYLSRWRKGRYRALVARRLFTRLADAGRYAEIEDVALAAPIGTRSRAAAVRALYDCALSPGRALTDALISDLRRRTKPLVDTKAHRDNEEAPGVPWALIHSLRAGTVSKSEALRILDLALPPHLPMTAGSDFGRTPTVAALLGHTLRAYLNDVSISLELVANDRVMKGLERNPVTDSTAREFAANVAPLLEWSRVWLFQLLSADEFASTGPVDLSDSITFAGGVSPVHEVFGRALKPLPGHNPPLALARGMAEIATRLIALRGDEGLVDQFSRWHTESHTHLVGSHIAVARIAARHVTLHGFALDVVTRLSSVPLEERTDSEIHINMLVDLSRALLAEIPEEAEATFITAVEYSELIGDDLHARWRSLNALSECLPRGTEAARAYRLFQVAEQMHHQASEVYTAHLGDSLWHLHEPTYFSALSRARDRRTLDLGPLLRPAYTAHRHGASAPDPTARTELLALWALQPRTSWESAFSTSQKGDHAWSVLTAHNSFQGSPPRSEEYPASRTWTRSKPSDVTSLAVGFDLSTSAGWNEALRDLWQGDDRRHLLELAFELLPTQRPAVLKAFADAGPCRLIPIEGVVAV